jgi:superfamily II DNA/RNA helicase
MKDSDMSDVLSYDDDESLGDGEDDGSEDDGGSEDDEDMEDDVMDDDDDDEPSADDDSDAEKKKKKKNKKKKDSEIKDVPPDPYLIRREATLLNLVLKSFKKRVIVFFNEKVQCHRMLLLFKIFKLKAVEVNGNLT